MTCIFCFQRIENELTWDNIIAGNKKNKLCKSCTNSFIRLEGSLCSKCSQESNLKICLDCVEWSSKFNGVDILTKNISLFKYTSFTKNYLATWKYQGDYILIDGIEELIKAYKKEIINLSDKTYKIIPIPLSEERLKERAFNQAAALAHLFGDVEENMLMRNVNDKQSKKTKQERINTINSFKVIKPVKGDILLIDDIYTTGATLRQAAIKLLNNGASKVSSFTLFRS